MQHSLLMWLLRARGCAPTYPQVTVVSLANKEDTGLLLAGLKIQELWEYPPRHCPHVSPGLVSPRDWRLREILTRLQKNCNAQTALKAALLRKTENCTFLIILGCGLGPESREQALGNEYHNQIDGLLHYWHNWIIHSLNPTNLNLLCLQKRVDWGWGTIDNIQSLPNLTCIWHHPRYFIASFCF